MKEIMSIEFMDPEWRGIDQTCLPPHDCSLYQNAPFKRDGKLVIPKWWIEELESEGSAESTELVATWLSQIACGEAILE